MSSYIPHNTGLLIKKISEAGPKMKSGLYLPEKEKDSGTIRGTVINSGTSDITPGSIVHFPALSGFEIETESGNCLWLKYEHVLVVELP